MSKNYWLLKSEPSAWSWDDQVKSKIDMWDGVRNYQARNNLMKMKKKDLCFFYHSVSEKKIIGIVTDGQIRRYSEKYYNFHSLPVKKIMTKNPITIDKNEFAAKALSVMNSKKITSLIVNTKKRPSYAVGIIHVHTILQSNIS